MVRSDQRRDSGPLALWHSSLPILPGAHPWRRDAALKPVDLQGQPMEVPGEPMHLRKEQARLRGAPTRWEERPTGLRTAATGLGREVSAAPLPPWIVPRPAHG
jgi:hypothetical protein